MQKKVEETPCIYNIYKSIYKYMHAHVYSQIFMSEQFLRVREENTWSNILSNYIYKISYIANKNV